MAFKVIQLISGRLKEVLLGVQVSGGAGDANKVVMTDSAGKIDETFLPAGIGSAVKLIEASENLTAGPVNIYDDSGPMVRKADATVAGKEANGFVLAAFTTGENASVYFDDELTGLSGLTPGARQYLSTTAGQVTETPPSASGNIVQCLGVALSATSMIFDPEEPIELA